MTELDNFEKQPSEEFRITVDFGLNFQTDETLVVGNCSVYVVDGSGQDVSTVVTDQSTIAVVDGAQSGVPQAGLQILVRGGDDLKVYKFTFNGVTSLGHTWEHDIDMKVKGK